MDITVRFDGPLFDGSFSRIMGDVVEEVQFELGNLALERVQYFLDRSIRHPTPYYETQIIQQRVGRDEVVHDRGIIYGPWLEGVSARNGRSRFKGYASFRRARDEVQRQAPAVADRVIARNMPRLGGS